MAKTKLSGAKVPNMKGVAKPKKLGLLTPKGRQQLTLRMRANAIKRLSEVRDDVQKHISYKLSRTDVLEALILWASRQSIDQLHEVLLMLNDD